LVAKEGSVKAEASSLYNNGLRGGVVSPATVAATMRAMTTDGAYKFDPDRPRPNLTLREKEVLRLVCDGLTNAEIATTLTVSRETIKSELKRIFRKIGVANRTQAAVLLVKQGWI
jgi:DNA-binding NarL/FixJ family response regulator